MKTQWSEEQIAHALHFHVFDGNHVAVLRNTYFPGDECDILVVRNDLRLVEVEVKISRDDLKADAKKEKWWHYDYSLNWKDIRASRQRIYYPRRIWKHYYALPGEIWSDDLLPFINARSGILLLYDRKRAIPNITVKRHGKPNKEAKAISPAECIQIAKLCSVRMWEYCQTIRDLKVTASLQDPTNHKVIAL